MAVKIMIAEFSRFPFNSLGLLSLFWVQVSGLKSITSKHLALASQVISFVHAIIPGKNARNTN